MPQPLGPALEALQEHLDAARLVRAVATGRRRSATPAYARAELRALRIGERDVVQQVLTEPGGAPVTTNLDPVELPAAVARLLAEPFGSWLVQTRDRLVQLRVTKRGEAQVHVEQAGSAPAERSTEHDRQARHLIDPGDPLFTVLGADAAKRRQVDAFLRQLEPAVRRLEVTGRALRVVDLGCGNAYLTMAAHRYLASGGRDVQTVGVDVRVAAADRNAALAAEIGLAGLRFEATEISATDLGEPDVVLALHACDTATDDALALAVRHGARAVLAAPCCHHDVRRQLDRNRGAVPHPYAGLLRQPILRERFADVLTDALRADLLRLLGYAVDVVEFVDSVHTPRNAMIRASFTGAPASPRRVGEYSDLVAAFGVEPALAQRLAGELDAVLR